MRLRTANGSARRAARPHGDDLQERRQRLRHLPHPGDGPDQARHRAGLRRSPQTQPQRYGRHRPRTAPLDRRRPHVGRHHHRLGRRGQRLRQPGAGRRPRNGPHPAALHLERRYGPRKGHPRPYGQGHPPRLRALLRRRRTDLVLPPRDHPVRQTRRLDVVRHRPLPRHPASEGQTQGPHRSLLQPRTLQGRQGRGFLFAPDLLRRPRPDVGHRRRRGARRQRKHRHGAQKRRPDAQHAGARHKNARTTAPAVW